MLRRARFAVAAAVFLAWLCVLQFVVDAVRPEPEPLGRALVADLRTAWDEPGEIDDAVAKERAVNPEWDFMGRTFLVLALANNPPDDAVSIIDRIIVDTLAADRPHAFLLPYSRRSPFVDPQGSSLFVDGEVALMLAARHTLAADPRVEEALRSHVDQIVAHMGRGPVLSGESYPDECWTFCNTTALAAIALSDQTLGTDHAEFLHAWVEMAKRRLIDPETGLLVSSYTYDGEVLDGPEGSSLWMVAHNLRLIDPEFARAQFEAAREQLYRSALGFGWAKEWPKSGKVGVDIDSGPIVPGLGASAGSSGMALLAATSFDDAQMRDALLRSMELAAFPVGDDETKHYAAAGRIGNAVAAYALSSGSLWEIR